MWAGRPSLLVRRLGRPDPGLRILRRPAPVVVTIASGLAAAVAGYVLTGPVGAVAGLACVPVVRWWLGRRRASRLRQRREADVAEGCVALAGELASGVPAARALAAVAAEWPELFGPAAGRAALGGDPAAALHESAATPGAGALRAVAAAWEVSERTGAGLSAALVAVADSVRAEATVRREAQAQLASVRATSRLMACLPAGTLLLFSAGDGDAVGFLTGTAAGIGCLLLATLFVGAGLFWVDRVSRGSRSVWES
nr:type II secretion system F family protein [Jiangella mangrovi]